MVNKVQVLTIEDALSLIGFLGKQEADRVRKHEIVTAKLDSLTDRELAAGFALMVKIPAEDLESMFLESKEKQETDPTIQQMGQEDENGDLDFSQLKLLPAKNSSAMVKAYLNAKPGDDLNISKEEMDMFHSLDKKRGTQDQVEEVLRQVLTKRLNNYREKGLEGIAPYCRKGKNFEPGKELLERTSKLKVAQKISPELVKHMIDYPNSKPDEGVQESFSWINFNIDDMPTISLIHKVFWKEDNLYVMMHRHFYVSRGHNSVQAAGVAFPVEEGQTFLYFGSRTSTDLVSGFGGAAKRAMGSRIMGGRLAENMKRYRAAVEQKQE